MAILNKITLSLGEIQELEAELNGSRNQRTGEVIMTGILNQKLPIKTKYWLTRLGETLISEKKTIDAMRDELVKKYGKETEDKSGWTIPLRIEDKKAKNADGSTVMVPNPAFAEFNKEYTELLETTKEIEYPTFYFEDFAALETSDNYAVFFKLLTITETV